MSLDYSDLSTPAPIPDPQPACPIREARLWRIRDREDAAILLRLGALLLELANEAGQFGPEIDEATIRPALLAAAQDLPLDASNLTEGAAECRWIDAWAFQVPLIVGSILRTVGVETGEPPAPVDTPGRSSVATGPSRARAAPGNPARSGPGRGAP